MKLAYADPVYLGMSKLYPEHPESHVWDDLQSHLDLMSRLDAEYEGWALSLSVPSLRLILPHSPSASRLGSWNKSFAAYKANVRVAYTWEPVIYKQARESSKTGAPPCRDHITAAPSILEPIAMQKGLTGAKPEAVCSWILDLLGWLPGDDFTDLFPGTGVMDRVVAARSGIAAEGQLELFEAELSVVSGLTGRDTA